jgi:hypothetical protein
MWRDLPEEEKEPYKKLALEDKKRYRDQLQTEI